MVNPLLWTYKEGSCQSGAIGTPTIRSAYSFLWPFGV